MILKNILYRHKNKFLDLNNLSEKEKFNKYGIVRLDSFVFNHKQAYDFYNELALKVGENKINSSFKKYDNSWNEIPLILNWERTSQSFILKDKFHKLISQFNSGIRYMAFYSAKPGLKLHLHRDLSGSLLQGFIRLHIPIITHKNCIYLFGKEENPSQFHARKGFVYALDTGYLHGVRNNSSTNRIHLMIEIELNRWLKKYLPKFNINFFLHFLAFYFYWAPKALLKDKKLFFEKLKFIFKYITKRASDGKS